MIAPRARRVGWLVGACAAGALACGSERAGFDDAGGGGGIETTPFADAGGPCRPHPGNFEIPDNGCDDDGDGVVDGEVACDADLHPFAGADDFAKAIGLCARASGPEDERWGVISAAFTRGHAPSEPPADGQHAIFPTFGDLIKAREGHNLGVLSTGWARPYDSVDATSCDPVTGTHCFKPGVQMQSGAPIAGGAPPGYPKAVQGCAVSDQVFDAVSLKLIVKVPNNARGFSLDFSFWSGEWPDYVCTRFNDAFLIYLRSTAFNGGAPENVAFDAAGAPISVNSAFFDRCTSGSQTGCRGEPAIMKTSSCGGDLRELEGTGFYAPGLYCNEELSTGGGSTGWLTATAPVTPGEVISLELLMWDTGDPRFDSTTLVDRFRWLTAAEDVPSVERVR